VAAKLIQADRGMERHVEAERTAHMSKWKGKGCGDWGSGS